MALYDMVFEGGGAKGSAFVGALRALHERKHSHRRLIGTSAGAITAALLAAGYEPDDMLTAVNEKLTDDNGNVVRDSNGNPVPRFSSFMDIPTPDGFDEVMRDQSVTAEVFRKTHVPGLPNWEWLDRKILNAMLEQSQHYCQLFSLVECGGLFAGSKFRSWLVEKLDAIGQTPNKEGRKNGVTGADTFEEFYQKTQTDLSLVATDTTETEMLVLNHRTAPKLPVVWAVRMSMSIPFVWREVVWDGAKWGDYCGRSKMNNKDERGNAKGNIIVDGGVLSNFPIRLIINEPAHDAEVKRVMGGDTVAGEAGNLGLLIDENIEVANAGDSRGSVNIVGKLRTAQRISHIMDTMMQANDASYIHEHEEFVCRLPAKAYGTTDFGMTDARLNALVQAGYNAMVAHLDKAEG
jgi:NTE family protein